MVARVVVVLALTGAVAAVQRLVLGLAEADFADRLTHHHLSVSLSTLLWRDEKESVHRFHLLASLLDVQGGTVSCRRLPDD